MSNTIETALAAKTVASSPVFSHISSDSQEHFTAKVNSSLPVLTLQQVEQINHLMVEEYGLGYLQMMEQAGRSLTSLTRRLVGGNLKGKSLVVLVGPGNKGGTGLVAARCLHNAGAKVCCIMSRSVSEVSDPTAHQYRILSRLSVQILHHTKLPPSRLLHLLHESDLTLDTVLGSGLQGSPRGSEEFLVQAVQQATARVVALDVPSGLQAEEGIACVPTLHAQATLALGLPKVGVVTAAAAKYVGELYLSDIGVPPVAYAALGLQVEPLFSTSDIIMLRRRQL